MEFNEFNTWVNSLVKEGQMSQGQAEDIINQRRNFDAQRKYIEENYVGYAVGYVNGDMVTETSVGALLAQASDKFPGRMVYFEPIAYEAF